MIKAFKMRLEYGMGPEFEKRGLYGHHPHGFEHEDVFKIVDFFEGSGN